ncbi:two-component sensor histidine kinase [Sulfurimonas gotlandica GD1]|uniref:Two-component sensor histidine kinase n=1 Tax=Sulfurimonas gotlandica (strain DSM 19862 / JCM 16533 / GD1) TaxID=929558 RepID=H1FS96_SULGG|nr:two-component sensor histidine kinase [Sulfurimonas gotlandica GD1]
MIGLVLFSNKISKSCFTVYIDTWDKPIMSIIPPIIMKSKKNVLYVKGILFI